MKRIQPIASVLTLAAALAAPAALAGVSATEAARLKADLTPLGAERAGNKEGTIPAWTGGMAQSNSAAFANGTGGRRLDPFKDEKPLYTVTAKNMDQYADKLNDGTKAMLKRYPDTYRLDVYPTHRTASASAAVYDNTFKNATRGKLEGGMPKDVYGGIPFPVPTAGAEVIWNHLMRIRPASMRYRAHNIQVTNDGRTVLAVDGYADMQIKYFEQGGSPEAIGNGEWMFIKITNMGPALRAGEQMVARENLDPDKTQAWTYLTGQRRVRRLPNPCCDTPSLPSAGVMTYDEAFMFTGRTDRLDWKIVGKKEMLIPYNVNRMFAATKDTDLVGPRHFNPDLVRWELHRVWVLEATPAAGQRHMAPRSRYYLDEDSWLIVLTDRWDAKGQLWRTQQGLPFVAPDLPAVLLGTDAGFDLLSGSYFASSVVAEMADQFVPTPKTKESMYTPEAIMADGVR